MYSNLKNKANSEPSGGDSRFQHTAQPDWDQQD